jgi:hypothetical protein
MNTRGGRRAGPGRQAWEVLPFDPFRNGLARGQHNVAQEGALEGQYADLDRRDLTF